MQVFKPPSFLSLDLEMEQPSAEIISAGVAVDVPVFKHDYVDNITNKHFSYENVLIKPTLPISEFIQDLTGLKDEMYDKSFTREDGFIKINELVLEWRKYCHDNDLRPMFQTVVWGSGDVYLFRKQFLEEVSSCNWYEYPIGKDFINVKTLIQLDNIIAHKYLNKKTSLRSALKRYGMRFVGNAHDSSYDALNTLLLFSRYVDNKQKQKEIINQLIINNNYNN